MKSVCLTLNKSTFSRTQSQPVSAYIKFIMLYKSLQLSCLLERDLLRLTDYQYWPLRRRRLQVHDL